MDEADMAQEKMEVEYAAKMAQVRMPALPPFTLCGCGDRVGVPRAAMGFRTCLDCAQTVVRNPRNLLGRRHP